MSKSEDGFPVFVELYWDKDISVEEIQIIFDSGMHRILTLSHSDAYADKMIWGKPQPETVKDYIIEGFYKKERIINIKILDNFQRKNIHYLKQIKTVDRIRITILSTNGIDHARIHEVRVYSSSDRSFR